MNTLYSLFEEVIKTKNFKLEEMTRKIKRSYIAGDITAEEQTSLIALVNENLNPETERPEWFDFAKGIIARIEALEKKVNTETSTPEEAPKYEKWAPWDGESDKYQYGDIVEHNGVLYENILYLKQNTWEPGVIGTHGIWRVYEGEV
jgi:methionyl-tRNA formyltransferase